MPMGKFPAYHDGYKIYLLTDVLDKLSKQYTSDYLPVCCSLCTPVGH